MDETGILLALSKALDGRSGTAKASTARLLEEPTIAQQTLPEATDSIVKYLMICIYIFFFNNPCICRHDYFVAMVRLDLKEDMFTQLPSDTNVAGLEMA